MRLMNFILLFVSLIITDTYSQESAETFILKFYDKQVRVTSPAHLKLGMAIILENHTLLDLRGKLITGEGEVIKYFSVKASKFETILLSSHVQKRLYIVPQSPAIQEIELEPGRKSYEVPAQK